MTLFTVQPSTHQGMDREGNTDLHGWGIFGPDGSEVDWSFPDHRDHAERTAARLNGLYPTEADIVPCRVCGAVVTSGDPSRYPYCRNCHYVGSASEDVRAESLLAFRVAFPDANVGIQHTGGGCFWMTVGWEGSDWFYALTDGEASLPTDSDGNPVRGGWGYVGRYRDNDEHGDYDEVTIAEAMDAMEDHTQGMTDDVVISIIRADRASYVAADESL